MTDAPQLVLLVPYLAAMLFVLADARGTFARTPVPTPLLPAPLWAAMLLLLYAMQLALTFWAATHQLEPRLPYQLLPLPVVDMSSAHKLALSVAVVAIGAAQAYALLGLYRTNPSWRLCAAGFAVMAAFSLASPSLASFDAYGYVHNALLGRLAYTPPATPLPGEFHVIDLWFGAPTSTLYGPLWLAIVRTVTVAVPGLLAKIVALRIANVAMFAAMLALLRVVGLPRRSIAIAALNPALQFQFVANAHNDIIAVVVLLAAAALVRGRGAVASGLVVVAGLIKLPFAILGLPMLSAVRPGNRRLLLACVAVAATVVLSWVSVGEPYVQSIARFGVHAGPWRYWHLPAFALAIGLIVAAAAGARRYRAAVWLIPAIGAFGIPFVYPWYFVWGLIYALPRRRVFRHLLIGFPLAAALVQHEFWSPITILMIFPIVTVFLCLVPPQSRAKAVPA